MQPINLASFHMNSYELEILNECKILFKQNIDKYPRTFLHTFNIAR